MTGAFSMRRASGPSACARQSPHIANRAIIIHAAVCFLIFFSYL
jgi:hypothetical protein